MRLAKGACVVLAVLCAALAIQVGRTTSSEPVVLLWSLPRFVALAALAGATLVFLAGAVWRPLSRFGLIVAVNAALVLAGGEATLRLAAERLPLAVVQMLPTAAARPLLARLGAFTDTTVQGDGQLYSYRPSAKFADFPWLVLDQDGYRNPSPPPAAVDVVLLGDFGDHRPDRPPRPRRPAARRRDECPQSRHVGLRAGALSRRLSPPGSGARPRP